MVISDFVRAVALLATLASCASRPTVPIDPHRITVLAPDGNAQWLPSLWTDRELSVLVFWSSECPCVRRYGERVDALLTRFPKDRVRVVAVSSNAGESFEESRKVATARAMKVPLFRDELGLAAEHFRVRSTPSVVVVDAMGSVRFRGWIDNEHLPGAPGRQPWLEDAVDALLAARPNYRKSTPVFGCPITRDPFSSHKSPCCTQPKSP